MVQSNLSLSQSAYFGLLRTVRPAWFQSGVHPTAAPTKNGRPVDGPE